MAKRPHSPAVAPPPKCSRKPPGFRVARPPPNNSDQASSSSNSLFITVSQPDEQRGTLKAQTRVLSSAPGPSTPSISANTPQPEVEQWDESTLTSGAETGPKRKRKTKNSVRKSSEIVPTIF